jgi:RNA-directed DNA polymerase
MGDGEPRLMGRDEQTKLVTDLKVALVRASRQKLDWICEQIREALYQANLGLEPENLEQIRPLMMVLLKSGVGEQGCPSKEEKQPLPALTADGKPPSLQDLRRRIYAKAKAEPAWRFWGLHVHVTKMETLREAYRLAKANNGAPGIDGVTFEAIEESGAEGFLEGIRDELASRTYRPMRNRVKEIPKGDGRVRTLGIPAIRDRVVQGALKLILEPIFEADFQPGSFGYRPKRQAHEAVDRVAKAIVVGKTRVIDVDLKAFFDDVRHHILLEKVAKRVRDDEILRLVAMILNANGKKGVPQGGVISPLLSNVYLNEVDRMLERAKETTRQGEREHIEYARFADDLVILVNHQPRWDWLLKAAGKRLREELAKLDVVVNEEKTRNVDLEQGESFGFLGFEFRRIKGRRGKWRPYLAPKLKKRTALIGKLREVFRRFRSQPVTRVVELINPILRGWVNYFRVGDSNRCFCFIRQWVIRKIRRHLMRNQGRSGYGWKRWSNQWLYRKLGVFNDYRLRRFEPRVKALPGH